MLLQAGREQAIPDRAELGLAVTNLANEHPSWLVWGGGERHLEILFGTLPPSGSNDATAKTQSVGAESADAEKGRRAGSLSQPVTEWVVRLENRGKALDFLQASVSPAVQELLKCRAVTNTVIFSPSASASGQAFDAALSICGLLLAEDKLSAGLSNAVLLAASQGNRGVPQPVEEILFDMMSLGQRMNWAQLVVFVKPIEDSQSLRLLSNIARKWEEQLPVLFSAVTLSGNAAAAGKYVLAYSQSGLRDLGGSLRFGAGGINELLKRQQLLYDSRLRERAWANSSLGAFLGFGLEYAWQKPGITLAVKWLLYVAAGFLLAMALHFARAPLSGLEGPLQVRGFHLAREFLFALGFLVVVLILSEPFLAQESQRAEFALRLRLPTVGSAAAAGKSALKTSFMDPKSLLTLLLFFVLQALIYTACLVKLAEIRRQRISQRMKLRLLENEEHLFDAGLYLGFAGTIISLILVSLGLIKPSLMAAYSSTSFGIIFVSIFKIFHLRPMRRRLLLEAEAELPQATLPTATARPLAAPL